MDGRNEQTEIEDHTLVDIEEQATQHVVTAMKGKLQSVSGRQKTMDGRNEQTEMSEVNIPISSSHGITRSLKSPIEMDGRNVQSETEDQSLIVDIKDNKQDTSQLKRAMEDKLQRVSRISEHRCIYRVPKHLRDTNEAAYVPRLVSLGPFHHGNENLKSMEEHKLRCFNSFKKEHKIDLGALLGLMKEREEKTREYYADRILLPSDEFVQVILVDAIFVINFLLQFNSHPSAVYVERKRIHHEAVFRDMMLLENQLPLFILEEILFFVNGTEVTSITELFIDLFNSCMKKEDSGTELSDILLGSVAKLANCLFTCHVREGTDNKRDKKDLNRYNNARHFFDFLIFFYMPEDSSYGESLGEVASYGESLGEVASYGEFEGIQSISKLHKAGVRFKLAPTNKLFFDIEFTKGVLTIPLIEVSDRTQTIFRNLLAYDQCHHSSSRLGDYLKLMGMLIDTPGDVELLVKNKILRNLLPTEQEVSKEFNSLEKEVVIHQESFYYSDRCHKISKYCEKPRHSWMATLKQNYLDTPWKVISLIAAFILLVLTMIQTVCSVISL